MSIGLLILISAPSGAGKTSLVNAALEADPRLVVSVSHTTRPQRPGEQDGVNYHFINNNSFIKMVSQNHFLEHAEVFGNLYGTSLKNVESLRQQGLDVILEIDWQGADQVRGLIPDALSLFILPPSESVLAERLNGRGQDSAETIIRRLSEARLDMAQAPRYQYIIVNEDFAQASRDLLAVIHAARLSSPQQCSQNPKVKALLA